MKLILAILLTVPAFAAVTPATIWESRFAGNAVNGGGFDSTIASAGTDMSIFDNKNAAACSSCQSATVNISTVDAVTNNTTTVTSATANFSSALIGNTIYLEGTGTTTGWYQVTAVGGATSITVDRLTGSTGGTGVTINIGGAVGGGSAGALVVLEIATNGIQAGNTVYVKAAGWVAGNTTATNTFSVAGAAGTPITYIGYTTTRTDGGQVTIPTSTNGVTIFSVTATTRRFLNFIASRTGGTTVKGWSITGANFFGRNLKAIATTSSGIELGSGSTGAQLVNCWASGATGSGGINIIGSTAGAGAMLIGCVAEGGTVAGFVFGSTGTNAARTTCLFCISANNTGSTSIHGFSITDVNQVSIINSVAFGNAGSGLNLSATNNALVVMNSVFYGNGVYGIASTTNYLTAGRYPLLMNYNAFGANGTNPRNQVPTGDNDIALAGDPFTAGATMDFSLDASGITELRGFGFPGILQSGGTGYMSPGALMPAYSGGSGGQHGYATFQ